MADKELTQLEPVTSEDIKSRIYTVRGVQVMLDSDLAEFYRVETRILNQAVKRNAERFPSDFYFQLTKEEYSSLRFQTGTLKSGRGEHKKYLPYAFTEHGVVMLASLLRSEIAIKMSVQITRAFVAMRQTLVALASADAKIELLTEKIERLNLYIEEVMHDQNYINEEQRAINEETAMQLELINQSLAELQSSPVRDSSPHQIGFDSPMYNDK